MKVILEIEQVATITVPLEDPDRFVLPAHTRDGYMTVTRLFWPVSESKNLSHPITASAIDDDGIHWTLSLRMSDVPERIQAEIKKVLPDAPGVTEEQLSLFNV
jgi:hypothetical protein